MGKDKADKNPSKRLRENGSQTDEDDEHARLEEMNTKLDQVLTACGEIALLKDEIRKLRDEVKNLKQSAICRGRNSKSTRKPERNFCTSKRKQ